MRQLFVLECRQILTSITYWLFIAAITATFWLDYGDIDREEIRDASQPASVFYSSQNNTYAPEPKGLEDEGRQKEMMLALAKKLLYCYRKNSYEYYPFGYIKEKVFSEAGQKKVQKYLLELTNLDEDVITEKSASSNSEEIDISGEGAYVAKPGAGKMNEDGQYVFSPDEWKYVDEPSVSDDEKGKHNDLTVQVSFTRFKEIMDEISGMIGKNSYFSWPLIKLYYDVNDLDASPVTQKQHEEFFNKDKITGAFARYFCDSISLAVLLFPAFVITAIMIKDKRYNIVDLAYTKSISSCKYIFIRYFASNLMMLVPVLLLPLKSFIVLAGYAHNTGTSIDILAFPKYILGWILPTLLFVTALGMFLAAMTRSYISVLIMGVLWIVCRPSIDKIAGGNYELFDLVIRHNTLKGYGRMMQGMNMLVLNRIVITAVSFLLMFLSLWIYQLKRKGGLTVYVPEFIHNRKREF